MTVTETASWPSATAREQLKAQLYVVRPIAMRR
jgi:hypothetical protein